MTTALQKQIAQEVARIKQKPKPKPNRYVAFGGGRGSGKSYLTRLTKGFKMPTVDMDAAGSFEVYPNGTYRVKVKDWEFGESSKKKTKQVRIKCEMDNGKPYTEFIPITEASAWKIGNFIVATGIKTSGKLDTESAMFQTVLNQLKGRTLFITLQHDLEYNNNKSTGYARDDQQEESEFEPVDDTPEFAK
jgi:hypothetical protein